MGDTLNNRKIALCLTGSIASVKGVELARELIRGGADVTSFMTCASTRIIHPDAMEFATGKRPVLELSGKIEHLHDFDLVIIAPAAANTISKIALGIADNPVTTLALSTKGKILIAPAMHEAMSKSFALKKNIRELEREEIKFVAPKIEEGAKKLANIADIIEGAITALTPKDFSGKRFVITAGPTIEYIDPIRIITNKSSGKMGIELARAVKRRGGEPVLIYGPGREQYPEDIKVIRIETVEEMSEAVKKEIVNAHAYISAAAISDFIPEKSQEKISSRAEGFSLSLKPAPKILKEIKNSSLIKVGFKAMGNVSEKELISKSVEILKESGLSLIVGNDISKGVFGYDKNEVVIIGRKGVLEKVPYMEKSAVAHKILNHMKMFMD